MGLKLSNIPKWNLRIEFKKHHDLLKDKAFQDQFKGEILPIESPYMIWLGMPQEFLTLIVQRAILGIESYLPLAIKSAAYDRDMLTDKIFRGCKNPFGLGGRGTADNFYNRLPALLGEEYCLKNSNPELWETTRTFYSKIRNPLFHGSQIADHTNVEGILSAYEYMAEIYAWIDSWHPAFIPTNGITIRIATNPDQLT
jgi:hypothetical protein